MLGFVNYFQDYKKKGQDLKSLPQKPPSYKMSNTQSLTTEQRIAIIAEYNADKIKEIKELMEEESVSFAEWISNHPLDFQTAVNGQYIGLDMKRVTAKQLYEQKTK